MKQTFVPLVILFVATGLLPAQEDDTPLLSTPGTLNANGTTVGELILGDDKNSAGGSSDNIDWYSLPVTEASRLQVEVSSDDFHPYLILELPGGESYAHDGDYSYVPNLSVIVRQAGTARVGIMAYNRDGTGEYEVLVSHITSEALSIDSIWKLQGGGGPVARGPIAVLLHNL